MSGRRTARRTPSSWPASSSRGATRPRSNSSTCSFPTPTVARARADRAAEGDREARRARAQGRRTSGQTAEQLPIYNAYSADGDVTAELVYVNYGVPRDYDVLARTRHRRQGQDRHRALRRLVARHQAEGRGRARRDRLPHLLRPARRRLLSGRRLSAGRLAYRARRAARLRRRHAGLPRRSAHAQRRRDQGREAPDARTRRRR